MKFDKSKKDVLTVENLNFLTDTLTKSLKKIDGLTFEKDTEQSLNVNEITFKYKKDFYILNLENFTSSEKLESEDLHNM